MDDINVFSFIELNNHVDAFFEECRKLYNIENLTTQEIKQAKMTAYVLINLQRDYQIEEEVIYRWFKEFITGTKHFINRDNQQYLDSL